MTSRIDEIERRLGIMESDSHRGANASIRGLTLGIYSVLLALDHQGSLPLASGRDAIARAREQFDPDIGRRERFALTRLLGFMDNELQRRATMSPEEVRARWQVLPGGADQPDAAGSPASDGEDE
jgi:hypothetical protein